MSIRMIAIDLDGTLLHDDMTISAYSREVIQKAIQKGYEIVVATGRMWDSARSKVALLRLGNVPVICYTGAWIMWSETGEPILQDGLSADLASRVMLAARERGWEATAFWDNHIYMEKPNGSEAKYQKYRTQKPQYLGEAFYHPPMTVTRVVLRILPRRSEAASVPFWRAVSERRSPSSIRGMISSMCIKRASIKHRLSPF